MTCGLTVNESLLKVYMKFDLHNAFKKLSLSSIANNNLGWSSHVVIDNFYYCERRYFRVYEFPKIGNFARISLSVFDIFASM